MRIIVSKEFEIVEKVINKQPFAFYFLRIKMNESELINI